MSAYVGKQQLRLLIALASPTCIMLTRPDKSAQGLVERGLLRQRDGGKATCITAAGLRALADAMDAGRVEDALAAMKRDADMQRAKAEARRRKWEDRRLAKRSVAR